MNTGFAPTFAGGFSGGSSTTSHLAMVTWNWVLLYPQVTHTDDITFDASLKLPPGWKFGTALRVARELRGEINFAPVSLTNLVDSPVLAGEFFRAIPLKTANPTVEIDIAADSTNRWRRARE